MGFLKKYRIILWSFIAGLLYWLLDSLLDYIFFYDESLTDILIVSISGLELYIRISGMVIFLGFGIIIFFLNRKLQGEYQKSKESEIRFKSYIDHAPDGIFIANEKGKYIEVNDAACRITGYSEKELLNKTIVDLIPQESHESAREHFAKVAKEGRATGDVNFIKKDGSKGVWTVDAVKVSDTRFMGFVKDITDRQKILNELKESEQNFNSLAENISEVFWIGSADWQEIYYVNPEFEKTWNKSPESLYEKPMSWIDSVVSDDKQKVLDYINEIQEKKLKTFEFPVYRITSKANAIKWIRARGNIIHESKLDRTIAVGIAEDITDFKNIEDSLKQERDKAKLYLQISGVMFVALNEKGKISLVNEKTVETLGYQSENELLGKDWFSTCLPKEIRTEVKKVYKKIVSGDAESVKYYENPVLTKDGKIKMILWHNSDLKDNSGNIIGLLSSGHDITERKKSEAELERRREELEQMVDERMNEINDKNEKLQESQKALTYLLEDVNEARKEVQNINVKLENALQELEAFSYSVSHDLKAPLRAIDGFSQILLEEYKDAFDDEGKRYLNIVRENSQRMGELIHDLLELSRVGRKKLQYSTVDFNSMVKEIFNNEMLTNGDRKIKIRIHDLPEVHADRSLIYQVWQNYISNAFKFTSNEKNASVEIGYKELEKDYEFYVRDNGVGFDMKYIDKLFNVFQRLHTIEVFEGTGVGLAIVKRVVEKTYGKCEV